MINTDFYTVKLLSFEYHVETSVVKFSHSYFMLIAATHTHTELLHLPFQMAWPFIVFLYLVIPFRAVVHVHSGPNGRPSDKFWIFEFDNKFEA